MEKIAELCHQKQLEGITDLRDETDRNGMRIVIELKKDVYPQVILNHLYKHTQMQETFGANMLALVDGKPSILNLREMIYYYLEHQKDVVTRRTRFDLDKARGPGAHLGRPAQGPGPHRRDRADHPLQRESQRRQDRPY